MQSGHPLESKSKPSGHSIRQVWAAHGALRVQFTRPAAGARVPGTSNPAASTHQQELMISLSHWISSNSPSVTLHLGVLTDGSNPLPPLLFSAANALDILSDDSFTFSQPVYNGSTQALPHDVLQQICSPHSSSALHGVARAGHEPSSAGHRPLNSALAYCRSNAHAQNSATLTGAPIAASHTRTLFLTPCRSRFAFGILTMFSETLYSHFCT